MPQFTALSGQELKSVFLAEISKAMDESGEFQGNLSYPWVKWTYSVKFTSYPKNAVDAEPVEVVVGEGSHPAGAPAPLEIVDDNTKIFETGAENLIIDTPDQARVDADLPLPTPTPVVNVGMVDKPVKQQTSRRGK